MADAELIRQKPLRSGLSPCQTQMRMLFGGEPAVLDACGTIYLERHGILAVADLHLEKGSFFAARGNPVPRYDTRDTLERLAMAIACYSPAVVICLGDSFHDTGAGERISQPDALLLETLMARVSRWIWLTGNHDPEIPCRFRAEAAPLHRAGAVHLAHLPETPVRPLIAGHYHPKLSLRLADRHVSGRCFLFSHELLLMPAFGAYAGGLDTRDEALSPLFAAGTRQHILTYRGKLWAINRS